MISPYTIDPDHRETLEEKILKKLNREEVLKPLRSKIEELCEAALDWTTDHLQGEYSLVLEDLVHDRAARLVRELLKGNHEVGQYFRLEKSILYVGAHAGQDFVYDPDGVRRAIVEKFRDEIVTAEMIALREENEQLQAELKWRRECR